MHAYYVYIHWYVFCDTALRSHVLCSYATPNLKRDYLVKSFPVKTKQKSDVTVSGVDDNKSPLLKKKNKV
jgi:hypothetical protein